MNPNYLDFEQPIADLEARIQDLRQASSGPAVNIDAELRTLQDKLRLRTAQIFRDLTPWQVSQLARHPARPYTNDYIRYVCDEFQELAGDRAYADDAAIVGGIGRISGDTKDKQLGGNVPVGVKVVLLREPDCLPIRMLWSDPVTAYSFDYVDELAKHSVSRSITHTMIAPSSATTSRLN